MLEFDEPAMKNLLVELDESEQSKGGRLADADVALLEELIKNLYQKGGPRAAPRTDRGAARRTVWTPAKRPTCWRRSSGKSETGRVFPNPRMGKDAHDRAIVGAVAARCPQCRHVCSTPIASFSPSAPLARERSSEVDLFDKDLQELVAKGKSQGYLTYDEVNDYLPDEEVNPDKLDNLLIALEEEGIDLVNEPPAGILRRRRSKRRRGRRSGASDWPRAKCQRPVDPPPPARRGSQVEQRSDPHVSLPDGRDSAVGAGRGNSLAKKIEVTRKRFRRTVIGCALAMQATLDTLIKVHGGILPFDRTIKVSLTERLTKEQIIARMPHNLATLEHLSEREPAGLSALLDRGTSPEERAEARKRFIRRRRKMLTLVEELSLRTRRVQAMMRQMEDTLARMDANPPAICTA